MHSDPAEEKKIYLLGKSTMLGEPSVGGGCFFLGRERPPYYGVTQAKASLFRRQCVFHGTCSHQHTADHLSDGSESVHTGQTASDPKAY